MKYSVITFGCRVNQADSMEVEAGMLERGAVPSDPEHADVVVVNTCSVTASADQAARQTIRRVARVNPGAKILVTGCYATRRPDELATLPNVAQVVTNDVKASLLKWVPFDPQPAVTTAERFGAGEGGCGAAIEPGVAGRTAFTLRVQTGCAEPCSYCIIPTTRGTPISLPNHEVLDGVARAAGSGFKEIALTGVHLGSYGRDLVPSSSLIDLLQRLNHGSRDEPSCVAPTGEATSVDVLFRISSLEPMDCTPAIVDLVAGSAAFAPHFHLPLQHASDRVLAAMRRPYTFGYFRDLVAHIRRRMPHAAIGSDIIVGFPGETDEDFAQLAGYLESSPLTHLHVFPYSDRPGTAAATMAGKVSGTVVRDRARVVRDIGHRLAASFRESQVGTLHRGLTLEDGSLVVTGNYLKVRVPPGRARNEWVDVRITRADDAGIVGELEN